MTCAVYVHACASCCGAADLNSEPDLEAGRPARRVESPLRLLHDAERSDSLGEAGLVPHAAVGVCLSRSVDGCASSGAARELNFEAVRRVPRQLRTACCIVTMQLSMSKRSK